MAHVDWRVRGPEVTTCNCNWGCPCQFETRRPTHGHCRAALAMRIDAGHFGDVRLDGLCYVWLAAWPGAVEDGGGECLWIVDEQADARQREALLTILAGKETEPMATHYSVFAATFAKVHEPLFKPIAFEVDIEARTGRFAVPGLIESKLEPIRDQETGMPHRARLVLPHGFHFTEAEFASSSTQAGAPILLDWTKGHGHFSMLQITPYGLAR